jgi:hypothetical protein
MKNRIKNGQVFCTVLTPRTHQIQRLNPWHGIDQLGAKSLLQPTKIFGPKYRFLSPYIQHFIQ